MTLEQLLVVQAHDSAVDRLRHQRENLPEFQALATLDDEQQHVETERATIAEERHEIAREQKRHEDEAAIVTDRINKENERLYSGTVTAHKDLQAIQDELETLADRRSDIEDRVLEAMEAGEPLDAKLEKFDSMLASIAERRAQASDSLAQSQAAIDEEISQEQQQRTTAVADVAADLVEQYEASRAANGGLGIVELQGKTCQGCHLTLSAVDYDRIRKEPTDAVVRCTECSRILVR